MAGHTQEVVDNKVLWGGGRSPFSVSYGKQMMWFFLVSDALTFGGLLTSLGFMKYKFNTIWPVSEEVFYHFPGTHTHLPLLYVALMTFILIVSSVTMVLAVEAGHRLDKKGVIKWLAYTVVGGAIFLGSQVWEWSTFIIGNGVHSTAFQLANGQIAHLHLTGEHSIFEAGKDAIVAAVHSINEGSILILADQTQVMGAEAIKMLQNGAEQVSGANLVVNEYGHPLYADFFFFITGFHGFHVFSGVVINLIILINVIKGVYDDRGHYEMVEKTGLYWHFVDLVWVFVFTFFYLI